MSSRLKSGVLAIAVIAALFQTPAFGDVRAKNVCATLPFPDGGTCFTGATCMVGARGAWLDLTDNPTVRSAPPDATVRIESKGVEQNAFGCVPATSSAREGYVLLKLTGISGTGKMNIRLSRPNAIGGRDSDDISFDVRDGTNVERASFTARIGEPRTLNLQGFNLQNLRVTAPDRVISQSSSSAQVELTFDRTGTISLEEKIIFTTGVPVLNAANGWPTVTVSPAPAPRLTARDATPLFRPQSVLTGGLRVDRSFCAGFAPREVRQVPIPAFEVTVANSGTAAEAQAFTVELRERDGAQRLLYSDVVVAGFAAGGTRRIRANPPWAGRQVTVQVENRTPDPAVGCAGSKCVTIPGDRTGCFLDQALNTVTPDPIIVIRVGNRDLLTVQ